jgi:hypothetical protein
MIGVKRGDRDQRVALDQPDVYRLTDELAEATRDHAQQAQFITAHHSEGRDGEIERRRLARRRESRWTLNMA